ncbi:MAG TPA: hypothetical protein PLP11_03580 [Bacteroidales bacterium]|nr:hypothetical protein [Bacteroidales bacterium]
MKKGIKNDNAFNERIINVERLKLLKQNYSKPEMATFNIDTHIDSNCSDMISPDINCLQHNVVTGGCGQTDLHMIE